MGTSPDPYANETKEQRDARMAWWREARFGLFIHWGVYAVPAGTHEGKQVPGIGEWIMQRDGIPIDTYREYAKAFNPTKYDPDAWVRLAKEAGMKYIVITSKHHDGFALFDSKVSEWDAVDATPCGKDLIAPLAEACAKHGIKLGLYYSQAQDWTQGGSMPGSDEEYGWDPSHSPETMDEYIDTIAVPQMKEILSNYGPISIIWWDTPIRMNEERAAKLIETLKLQPGIIHNNRLGGEFRGDMETPEQHIPSDVDEHDWEECMTMNDTWGYKSYDDNWKSTETLIHNLVDIASKGGNYLLNVGPKADGTIPEASVERLQQMGAWLKVNGESIYGSVGSTFPRPRWGRVTRKTAPEGTRLFLHVFDWQGGDSLFLPLDNEVLSCGLLVDSERSFAVKKVKGGLSIHLTGEAPDPYCSVIELKLQGKQVLTGANLLRQRENGCVTLSSEQAHFDGAGQWMGIDLHTHSIHGWVHEKAFVEWTFTMNEPGEYALGLEAAADEDSLCRVSVADQSQEVPIAATGGPHDFSEVKAMGLVRIDQPGEITMRIDPVPGRWKPVGLRTVRLTPVGE